MESIMPGIDAAAPDRTLTNNGSRVIGVHPERNNVRLDVFSRNVIPRNTSGQRSTLTNDSPLLWYRSHADVVMVNPGGTFKPRAATSCNPAPLPPSVCFISFVPSASPRLNVYIILSGSSLAARALWTPKHDIRVMVKCPSPLARARARSLAARGKRTEHACVARKCEFVGASAIECGRMRRNVTLRCLVVLVLEFTSPFSDVARHDDGCVRRARRAVVVRRVV